METDADVLRICEESCRNSRHPGAHGTQVRRIYQLAGRPLVLHAGDDCFYFTATDGDAAHFRQVVREARRRVDEQPVPSAWMAL